MSVSSLPPERLLNQHLVRARFNRHAHDYDAASALHQEVGRRLREHLEPVRITPRRILDAGAGTGICSRALAARYPKARIVTLDLAPAMLRASRARVPWWTRRQGHVCADAAALPLAPGSIGLLYSNLMLQWCDDLDRVLGEMARVAEPGALLMVSTLGPDTFRELRAAWGDHAVHDFADMHDVGDGLVRAGFTGVVMESESITVEYRDVDALYDELRRQAATNARARSGRGLTGRNRALVARRALEDGGRPVVLTYEVVYAHAWRAEPHTPSVPVEDLIRARLG